MNRIPLSIAISALAAVGIAALLAGAPTHVSAGSAIAAGDVMVSVSNGLVEEFTPTGTLVQTLDTGKGIDTANLSNTTGSAFDSAGNFYVTNFHADDVSKFDPNANLIGSFGSGYNSDDESIVFDTTGNVYVGQADGTHDILKFSSTGTLLATFSPAVEDKGTDWIDLAADNCTMFYTSEGRFVKRFNVCTNTQLTDFAGPLPGSVAYAHRIRPGSGELLVADTEEAVRLDSTGAIIQTYTLTGPGGRESGLFALNLDPDGVSFWTADINTGDVLRVNIETGAVISQFNPGTGRLTVFGLSVKGELVAPPTPTPTQTPTAAPARVGVSVEKFSSATLDPPHLSQLQSRCASLISNGSGSGLCTCGAGDSVVTTLGRSASNAPPFGDVYQVSYYDVATSASASAAGYGGPGFSGGSGDNTVRIVNPTAANGTLCAMIYVFDDNEQMQACCGCPVTPDGQRTLSVINDLTLDFGVNRGNLNAGTIEIVSSTRNFVAGNPPPAPNPPGTNGSCSPTGASSSDPFGRASSVNPTPGLRSWITHDELEQRGNIP